MPSRQDQIDTAQAAALAEEIAAAASGKINFDAGSLLEKIQERPDIESRAASSADDYVTIYDNWKGLASTIPVYMLAKKLRQRYPRENTIPANLWGRPVFSLTPNVTPVVGHNLCWFHTESPMRDEMDTIGYQGVFCTKSNIPTPIGVEDHMQHKHGREWANIQRHRDRSRNDGQNKALLELLNALVEREKGN